MDDQYKEYMQRAPQEFRERLIKVMRYQSDKSIIQIARDIGMSATTLFKFLKKPELPMRFMNLLKIEKYLEIMEKEIE